MSKNLEITDCTHEWATTCDGETHVDECAKCGLVLHSICTDANEPDDESY